MQTNRVRRPALRSLLVAAALVAAACSGNDDADDETGGTEAATTEAATATDTADEGNGGEDDAPDADDSPPGLEPAGDIGDVRPGVEQITLLDAVPGTEVHVVGSDVDLDTIDLGESPGGIVDENGSLVVRGLDGDVDVRLVLDLEALTEPYDVLGRDEHPEPAFFREQRLPAPGFGYLETRDGTTLSINVVLPGTPEEGPYPTVVEYSGYTPSDPEAGGFKDLFPALGYAYVGVNMRGTGCSGGSYRFFEYTQSTDGHDAIETIAAQPWVLGNRVGMVGVSYPGISQLFVAQTQPPSLAAITPLSVIDDSYNSTLYPGGILNTGFAVDWTRQRIDEAQPAPDGQRWAADRIEAGDEECAANQAVRLQNPDLVAEIRDNPFYTAELGDDLAPRLFVDRIEVPTFVAGAWQDEQTGGRFPTMLDRFTGTDQLYASLTNGLHTDSISPAVFPRFVEFLDLFVAERTPSLASAAFVAPVLASGLFGTAEVPPGTFDDRFAGLTHAEALAAFEAEPPIRVLFENGAADDVAPLTPGARFVAGFDAWPIDATPTTWYLDATGELSDTAPADASIASYVADPEAVPMTFWDGNSSDLWRTDVEWSWAQPPAGTTASFVSAPLGETLTMVGSGSVDLWLDSDATDTDVEVTLSEVRPDGAEVLVQSGWLRAGHRALDDALTTDLRPVATHLQADATPLNPPGEFDLVRVELFPFAHVFRAGSRLRLVVDAPGGNRPVWVFETIAAGETVDIATGGDLPSAIVLPVVGGVDVPEEAPACGSLRGQPCRPSEPAS